MTHPPPESAQVLLGLGGLELAVLERDRLVLGEAVAVDPVAVGPHSPVGGALRSPTRDALVAHHGDRRAVCGAVAVRMNLTIDVGPVTG